MDDQQGKVIDGTVRARHWRGSKSKTGSMPDGGEARSDAPKSFAGSLLVPAEMLAADLLSDGHLNGNGQGRTGALPLSDDAGTRQGACTDSGAPQNPFLVPEAARVAHRSRFARWHVIAAVLAKSRRLAGRHSSFRAPHHVVVRVRRLGELRLTRLLALVALTGAVVVTVVITTRSNLAHSSSGPALTASGPLSAGDSRTLVAASNSLARQIASRDRASHPLRRVRVHRAAGTHQRSRPASKSELSAPNAGSANRAATTTGSTSVTLTYSNPSTPAATTQPAPSTAGGATSESSSAGSSRPAFGQNGTLGPGHSPNS